MTIFGLKPSRYLEWLRAMRGVPLSQSIPKIMRALGTGRVPAYVWRRRIRTCMKCAIYDRVNHKCQSVYPGYERLGCGCACVFKNMTAAPYPTGCWGYEITHGHLGWPAHKK